MIICELHGVSEASFVSPDIFDQVMNSLVVMKPRVIEYEYLGDIVETFILSQDFLVEHKLCDEKGILPLPNDYPEWVSLLKPLCSTCLDLALQK